MDGWVERWIHTYVSQKYISYLRDNVGGLNAQNTSSCSSWSTIRNSYVRTLYLSSVVSFLSSLCIITGSIVNKSKSSGCPCLMIHCHLHHIKELRTDHEVLPNTYSSIFPMSPV